MAGLDRVFLGKALGTNRSSVDGSIRVSCPSLYLDGEGIAYPLLPSGELAVPPPGTPVSLVYGEDPDQRLYYVGSWLRTGEKKASDGMEVSLDQQTPAEVATSRNESLVQKADRVAANYGIPTALFRGFISQESGWNPRARSGPATSRQIRADYVFSNPNFPVKKHGPGAWRTGYSATFKQGRPIREHANFQNELVWDAWGLVQMLPTTALDLGLGFDESFEVLYDPDRNLDMAAKLIARLYKRAQGDWAWTAAMYYAGQGGVPTVDPTGWDGPTRKYAREVPQKANLELAGKGVSRDLPATAIGALDASTSGFTKGHKKIELSALTRLDNTPVKGAEAVDSQQPYAYIGANYPYNRVKASPGTLAMAQ